MITNEHIFFYITRFLHDATQEQMAEVKGIGRRKTQLLDDLGSIRRSWEPKKKYEDRTSSKRQFIT